MAINLLQKIKDLIVKAILSGGLPIYFILFDMEVKEKLRAQVKSRFYYLFWGAATVSVFAGQLFVGCGFRRMAESNDAISADINLLVEVLTAPSGGDLYYEPESTIEFLKY